MREKGILMRILKYTHFISAVLHVITTEKLLRKINNAYY